MSDALGIALLVIAVFGITWLFDALLPDEMRDWKNEPLEDDEETKRDTP